MDRVAQRKLTKEKRKSQTCKVYCVKVDKSHLSTKSFNHLSNLFREAKWFYNYCLSQDDVNDSDTTLKEVPVKVGEEYENRKLSILSGQMKQAIKARLFASLVSLVAKKKKGFKVGRLKFKSQLNSIPLKQLDHSFYIRNGKIRIQGMKQWLRVNGLEQLAKDSEIACAELIRKCEDYYIHITTYENRTERIVPKIAVGIDFGCETQLTFSNGIKVKFQVESSKRLRKLDRKIMRNNRPKSNNKLKDQAKRRKEHEKLTNKKKDIRHKLVSAVINNFKYVAVQDESIHAWAASGHGKKIQHSGIGGIISDLKHKSHTPLEVSKFFPSTKLCPNCTKKNNPSLSDRQYVCECGFSMDRDIKSAICIKAEGLKQIPMEHRKLTLGEILPSTFLETLSKINGIQVSKVDSLSQEALL